MQFNQNLSVLQALLRHRIRERWGPDVPHAETAEAAGGTRALLCC